MAEEIELTSPWRINTNGQSSAALLASVRNGYFERLNNTQSPHIIQTQNTKTDMASALALAGAGAAQGASSGLFSLGSSFVTAHSAQHAANLQLQLGKDTLQQQYKMWDRDYKIANQMGLYHPSQLASLGTPSGSDIYRLGGVRGFARVPRTRGRSIFG